MMGKTWVRRALFYGCLLLSSALFFQNCGPAKLSSSADASSQSVTDSALIGTKVDLNSLMQAPQEPAANVLFPSIATVNDYDYAVSAPIIENIVLKNNDFTRIEWIHAPSSTIIAVGDAFNQSVFSNDLLGPYYIIGYRGATAYRLSQFRLINKGATTLNVNSVGAIQLAQQVVSSDSQNEDVLVTMDAPAVDLSSVQINVKSKGLTVNGKRALLVTKKLAESIDVEMNIADTSGQSATKVITLAVDASPPPSPSPAPTPAPAPSSCSFNGQTLTSGSSVTAFQYSSVAYGNSCPSQVRSCSNGVLTGTYQYASCSVAAPGGCIFNGQTLASGVSVTAFQASSVPYGSTCVSETRSCSNGTLSGSYQYGSCTVATPATCSFNGQTIASGSSVTAYQTSSVAYGSTCASQTRTCSNGTLSGTYGYSSCTVGAAPANCTFNGQTIASGTGITAYQSSSVPYGSTCASQTRTCTNGTLSGSYTYGSCSVAAPASCSFNGQTLTSGSSITAYQSSSVPYGSSCTSQARTCTNGSLSGTYQYSSCSVSAPASCTFNGQTIASGVSVTAFQSSSVAYGGSCTSETRTCSNGTLSGSYQYGSCSVAAAASCTFNGQTISSGSSVTAYQASSVPYGSTCASQSRTCSNGSLSGTYGYSSCSVAAPLKTQILMLDTPNQTITAGNTLTLTLKFNVNPMPEDYALFVSFVDSNGNEAAFSGSALPSLGTSKWPTGPYSANISFAIPASLPMGTYSIRAGMFRNLAPPNNTRIVLDPGTGVVADNVQRYTVGTLNVNPASTEIFKLDQPSVTINKGQTLNLNIKFYAVPMAGDYAVFIHMVDSSGAQHSDMNGGWYPSTPTSQWSGMFTYSTSIAIPSTAPSGTYTIRAGLFKVVDPYTDRLPLIQGPGVTVDGETRYTIGTMTIP